MDLVAPRAALRLAVSLAARPGTVLCRGAGLVAELGQVGLGTSTLAPHHGDDRFSGWLTDPLRRRVMQTYLATVGAVTGLLDDVAGPNLPDADEARLREIVAALGDLVFPAGTAEPNAPDPADPVPGRDLATTPGAVVLRTPMFELLQYLPRTDLVRDVPVLVVPPVMHRYYLADLVPGHSLVEHLVDAGLQVFALSWPDTEPSEAAGRDPDTYAAAVLDAVEACTRIARCPRVTLAGLHTGGLLAAAAASHLSAIGRADRVAAAVYLGTALPGFRLDTGAARVAADRLPEGPARRALRYWADDLLRLPISERPCSTVLGTPVEPHRLACDGYLVTAADDPAQPWTAGFRTAQLLGGPCRLVLAPGDRVGALLAVPDPDGFRAGPVSDDDTPDAWVDARGRTPGSWWPDLAAWLAERSGPLRDAPPELGGRRMHPVHPAPGTYLDR